MFRCASHVHPNDDGRENADEWSRSATSGRFVYPIRYGEQKVDADYPEPMAHDT